MRHKCLAMFLVFLLYFSITGVMIFWELKVITTSTFLTKVFKEANVYQNIAKLTNTLFSENNLQSKVIIQYYAENIPANYLQSELEKNLKPFLAYLNGETRELNVVFDLKPLKAGLEENTGKLNDLSFAEVEKLPVCTKEEEQMLISQTNQNEGSAESQPMEISCRPEQISTGAMSTEIANEAGSEIMKNPLPDSYNLGTSLKNPEKTFKNAKIGFKIIRWGFWFNLILTLILFGLLALLGKSWWPSIPRWIGWSMIIPAGPLLLLNLFWSFFEKIIQNKFASGFDPQIYNSFNPLFEIINQKTITASLWVSGIITGIGLILVILSYALPHPPEPKPVLKPTPKPAQTPSTTA